MGCLSHEKFNPFQSYPKVMPIFKHLSSTTDVNVNGMSQMLEASRMYKALA